MTESHRVEDVDYKHKQNDFHCYAIVIISFILWLSDLFGTNWGLQHYISLAGMNIFRTPFILRGKINLTTLPLETDQKGQKRLLAKTRPEESRRSRKRKGAERREIGRRQTNVPKKQVEDNQRVVNSQCKKQLAKKRACREARLPAKHMHQMYEGDKDGERETSSLRACWEESEI